MTTKTCDQPSLTSLVSTGYTGQIDRCEGTNTGVSYSGVGVGGGRSMAHPVAGVPVYPSFESLNRRFEASNQNWVEAWLADDVDPCSPE